MYGIHRAIQPEVPALRSIAGRFRPQEFRHACKVESHAFPQGAYEQPSECGYVAFVPALPGCHMQSETLEETEHNVKEAIALYVESLAANWRTTDEANDPSAHNQRRTPVVAECLDPPVVAQAATLDELAFNIRDPIGLHLQGEDRSELGFSNDPTILATMELGIRKRGSIQVPMSSTVGKLSSPRNGPTNTLHP
jgi:predicted RNase H-like HicB family nuclease